MSLFKVLKQKKCSTSFNYKWLNEIVNTDILNSRNVMCVRLHEIFTYDEDAGVVCMFCHDAKVKGEFAIGKY